ncbi:uncharacterized protein LOC135941424 [Cloeon dipterum]|uniref:uncharacterized protein LOC135941424 n=1 Tax=Cloeon dipterum TaxID=197152 RepID=UPI00322082E5
MFGRGMQQNFKGSSPAVRDPRIVQGQYANMAALRPPFPGRAGPCVNAAQNQFMALQRQQNPGAAGESRRVNGCNVDNLRDAQQRSAARRLQGVLPAVLNAEELQSSRYHYRDTAPPACSWWSQRIALSGQPSFSGQAPHHFQGDFYPQPSGQQTASPVPSYYTTRADYRSPGPSGVKPPVECPSRPPTVHKPIIESGMGARRSHPPRQPRQNHGSLAQAGVAKRRRRKNTARASQAASSSASTAVRSAQAAPSSAASSAAQLASSSSASVPGSATLDRRFLKVRSTCTKWAIRDLHHGKACSNCTIRFTAAQKKEYALHLDAHFLENRRLKENAFSRGWFAKREEWCGGEQTFAITVRVQPTETEVAEEEKEELPTLPARAEEPEKCGGCFEEFDQTFDQDAEEWRLQNAIMVEGVHPQVPQAFHPQCRPSS